MAQAAGSAAAVALGAWGRDGEGGIRRIFAAQAGIHQFHDPKRETYRGDEQRPGNGRVQEDADSDCLAPCSRPQPLLAPTPPWPETGRRR